MPGLALIGNPPPPWYVPRQPNPGLTLVGNPAPGYQSFCWTQEDWRAVVPKKGGVDYRQKCGAEGTRVRGKPALCLPAAVVKRLLRSKEGKKQLMAQARAKLRAASGERVQYRPLVKKAYQEFKAKRRCKDRKQNPGIVESVTKGLGALASSIAGPHNFKVGGVPVQFALTGPAVTFTPFSPFQKVSVDLFGSAARVGSGSGKKNPPPRLYRVTHKGTGEQHTLAAANMRAARRVGAEYFGTAQKNLSVATVRAADVDRHQQSMFGVDVDAEIEREARERSTGQRELFGGGASGPEAPPSPPGGLFSTNPPTVVVNVHYGKAHLIDLSPEEAVREAWRAWHKAQHGPMPCERVATEGGNFYVRCGPFLAMEKRRNPASTPPGLTRSPLPRGYAQAFPSQILDMIYLASLSRDVPQAPGVTTIDKRMWSDMAERQGRTVGEASHRAYERFKQAVREYGLAVRPESVFTPSQLSGHGAIFAFDTALAFDMAWVALGSPHPAESDLTGTPVQGRDLELLAAARKQARGDLQPGDLALGLIEDEEDYALAVQDYLEGPEDAKFPTYPYAKWKDLGVGKRLDLDSMRQDVRYTALVQRQRREAELRAAELQEQRLADFEARRLAALEARRKSEEEARRRAAREARRRAAREARRRAAREARRKAAVEARPQVERPQAELEAIRIDPEVRKQNTLRFLREVAGRTSQAQVAEVLGIKAGYLNVVLSGRKPVTAGIMRAVEGNRARLSALPPVKRRARGMVTLGRGHPTVRQLAMIVRHLRTNKAAGAMVGIAPQKVGAILRAGQEGYEGVRVTARVKERIDQAYQELFGESELGRLMNPARPRRRNRDSKWKKPPRRIKIPIEELEGHPGLELAIKKYKRFHGTLPETAEVFQIPDGSSEDSFAPDIHVALGEVVETPYVVNWNSNKKDVLWYHEHPEDGRPVKVLNPRTGVTSDLGGTYVVDDWFYS